MSSVKLNSTPNVTANAAAKDSIKTNSTLRAGAAAKDKRDPAILQAAQGFENQFIRQMIAEMRKTVPKDEVIGESMADDIFRDQLDDQYADMWTQQGGIGLSDLIYDQLQEKYGAQIAAAQRQKMANQMTAPASAVSRSRSSVVAPTSPGTVTSSGAGAATGAAVVAGFSGANKPRDILSDADKDLFQVKIQPGQMILRSKEPLPERVGLRSPLSGVVLQAAALEDGRQMVVLKHDQGLVTRFVHTGDNRVKNNMRVAAGEIIAELPASQNGEPANVVFELRQTPKAE